MNDDHGGGSLVAGVVAREEDASQLKRELAGPRVAAVPSSGPRQPDVRLVTEVRFQARGLAVLVISRLLG